NTTLPEIPLSKVRNDRGGLRGRWRYRLGRCVDAPVLHFSLDFDLVPDFRQKGYCHKEISKRESNHHHQHQHQPAAASGPAAQSSGLARGANPSRHCLRAIVACSHDGDVACLDEATGMPYWHVRLPARVEAGLAIAWGPNRCSGCGDTGVDARLITPPTVSTVLNVAAGGGTATRSVVPGGEAAVGIKAGQDAYTRRGDGGNVSFTTDCVTAPAPESDPDTRRHSLDADATHGARTAQAPLPQHQQYMMPYVIAACGNGVLYSLDLADGSERGAVDCGGEFKSPPVCDPWVGAIWATGHSRQLVVMRPPDLELGRIPLGAPMSISAAFASIRQWPVTHDGPQVATTLEPTSVQQEGTASPPEDATVTATANRWQEPARGYLPIGHGGATHHAQQQQQALQREQREQCQQQKQQEEQLVRLSPAAPLLRMALLATLDGRTHAIRVDLIETGKTSAQPPQPLQASPGPCKNKRSGHTPRPGWDNSSSLQGPLQLRLSRLWSLDGPAPVFSALLVLPEAPPLRNQRVGQGSGTSTTSMGHSASRQPLRRPGILTGATDQPRGVHPCSHARRDVVRHGHCVRKYNLDPGFGLRAHLSSASAGPYSDLVHPHTGGACAKGKRQAGLPGPRSGSCVRRQWCCCFDGGSCGGAEPFSGGGLLLSSPAPQEASVVAEVGQSLPNYGAPVGQASGTVKAQPAPAAQTSSCGHRRVSFSRYMCGRGV
ncbi:hypothetical protein Vafri_3529, partial [Volvox africanus]